MKSWLPVVRAGSGADVFAERLAEALLGAGVDVELTWFPRRYELLPELMRFHPVPAGVDVIHANSWNAHAFLGRGRPVVTTVLHLVHDPAYAPYRSVSQAQYHRWHVRWREARALRNSDAVTAISHYVAGTVRDFSGRGDVEAIPNWVDLQRYVPEAAHSWGLERPFRLLLVGNHTRRKGFDLLPQLATMLGPRFQLRCTGGLRGESSGAIPHVSWLGRLPEEELIREYKNCDAVISLSRYEGFGYTALEGMACGKPFVGFRCGAIAEVVDEEATALLADIDDIAGLARHCRRLAEDSALCLALGRAGRRRAESMFTEAEAATAYVAAYEKVVAGVPARRKNQ